MSTETESGVDALLSYKEKEQATPGEGSGMAAERLTKAGVLRSIHANLVLADEASERNRAKVQDLKDHKPPLNAGLLRRRGQSGRFNINFGEVAGIVSEAESGYIDSFVSAEHLVPIKITNDEINPSDKATFERICSDEFTRMVRGWGDSLFEYLTIVDQFVTHGIGIGYYKDRHTWQWTGSGLREFKFPRRTKVTSGAVEMTTCESQVGPAELGGYIQDEELATARGWNVQAVKNVLAKASSDLYDSDSAEDNQEETKANDYDDAQNPFRVVNLVYGWIKEMNGKVSFYITTKADADSQIDKVADDNFLYRSHEAYNSMMEAIHLFPFHTGNRGNIYTIRGLGYMVYSPGMASNLMQCSMLDSAKDSMSVKYLAPSEKGYSTLPIINAGPYSLVPPGLSMVADQKAPDLQKSAMPALQLLREQMESRSASSTLSGVFNNAPDRRSKGEALAAIEHFSSLNSAAMLLFSRPWRDLIVESVRRAFDPAQNDQIESGKMAKAMQDACVRRGVPKEVLQMIDLHLTKTSIPVGPGSKAARAMQFQNGASLYTAMDVTGRKAYDRDRAIDIWGPERASEYINYDGQPRELFDHAIARMENNDLIEGMEIEPSPSETFLVHLQIHVEKLNEYIELVEQGEMELTDATKEMLSLYEHAVATFEMAVVPEKSVPELNAYKQALQQIGEYVNNGIRALQKEQRDAQENGEGEGGEQQESVDKHQMQMQMDAEKAQQKLQQNEEAFAQKLVQDRAKALQDIAINDAKKAGTI